MSDEKGFAGRCTVLKVIEAFGLAFRKDPAVTHIDILWEVLSTIFERERCGGCHTPQLYTNNKLTLALGFDAPKEHFQFLDILQVSVNRPGVALKTRKGTGYYKITSLKGLWYRGRYLHDGSLTTVEEMFDPGRLKDDYVPGGFMPVGVKSRPVNGHEIGLKLKPEDRAALIAFLKTL